jgi:DNA-binding MarR family transcriptional regulator
MSEIVTLITEWDTFQGDHPDATAEEFCRHFLIKKREAKKSDQLFGGHMPPDINTTLLKLFGRLTGINIYHFKNGMKSEGQIDIETFTLLNSIRFRNEARKTDVINDSFMETSTGIDMLLRLRKAGYITERDDPSDKRARLVKLTPKGEQMLFKCYRQLGKIAFFMFSDMDLDDKKIILQILSVVDIKHSKIIDENRGKNLDELVSLFVSKEKLDAYEKGLASRDH